MKTEQYNEVYFTQKSKVELHVHLEGAILPETLLKLAEKNKIPLPVCSVEKFEEWMQFTDFLHFAEIYQLISRCIQSAEDIEILTYDFLKKQASENILHTEFTYTAWTHFNNFGISYDEQFLAIKKARKKARRNWGITSLIIVDIPREIASPEEAFSMTKEIVRIYKNENSGIVALGLGGYEVGFPPEIFKSSFDLAHANNLPCILHAGETEGPKSIKQALEIGKSQRIGHGIRCVEDTKLMQYLIEKHIPLEVCPTSNVCLKIVDSFASHPIGQLIEKGLNVTLNSDDPSLFSTSLSHEFFQCHKLLGISVEILNDLTINAVEASLLSGVEKQKLKEKIQRSTSLVN